MVQSSPLPTIRRKPSSEKDGWMDAPVSDFVGVEEVTLTFVESLNRRVCCPHRNRTPQTVS